MVKQRENQQISTKQINHSYTSEVVCPYCGFEFGDSWEFNGDDDNNLGLIECQNEDCGKEFYAYRNVEISYCTAKPKYGTCKGCNKSDVIIENMNSSYGKYEDLCVECGARENKWLLEIEMKSLNE